MKSRFPLCVAFMLSTLTPLVQGEVLLLDAIAQEPPNSTEGLARPTHGMTMDRVLARYGEPERRIDPVGVPPITRWVYPGYTVYFENELVLTAAVHR